jgi:pimeloyl-ACP methyl ester carboxylesterase
MTERTKIFYEVWGAGTNVVLVHGSLATGLEEWQEQRPLAHEGFRLLVPDRRGYGRGPSTEGEDFLRDAAALVSRPSATTWRRRSVPRARSSREPVMRFNSQVRH